MTLTAPAREGAANAACLAYLAEVLGIPRSMLSLFTGARSRTKIIRFHGLSQPELDHRLGLLSPTLMRPRQGSSAR